MTKLEVLRSLLATLAAVDARDLPCTPNDPGFADRDRAGNALAAVIEFLRMQGVRSIALDRLNAELVELTEHGQRGRIFKKPGFKGKQPTPRWIDHERGQVAAIVELRKRQARQSTKDAASWVHRHLPDSVKPKKPRTLEDWHERFRCYQAPKTEGQHGFFKTFSAVTANGGAGEAQLRAMLHQFPTLVRS